MLVSAVKGGKFPIMGKPGQYIESRPVEVPNTGFYRRALREGSLVLVFVEPTVTIKAKIELKGGKK